MPAQSVWLVRFALLYFLSGATIGGALQAQKALSVSGLVAMSLPEILSLRSVHIEFLLVGFMLHLAFGVALWILPKPPRPGPRVFVWIAAAMLNAGIWLVSISPAMGDASGTLEILGRLAEIGAVALFAVQVLPRVRSMESFRKA